MKVQNPAILLVEDDPNDQFFFKDAFKKLRIHTPIHVVGNGEEAIAYLNGEGEFADRRKFPFPTTVITDLKMPVSDGFSVIQHLKQNPRWVIIPIVVLSASADEDDIRKALTLGACAYHLKPSQQNEMRDLLRLLHDYWVRSEVPQTDDSGFVLETVSEGKLGERFSDL